MAIKNSRVSNKVKRTILRHEARVLQVLQGEAHIPAVYGYGQLDHFEYIAMELLGPSVADQQQKGGAGVMVEAVIRVVYQVVRATDLDFPYVLKLACSSQDYSISTLTALYIAISSLKTCCVHWTMNRL